MWSSKDNDESTCLPVPPFVSFFFPSRCYFRFVQPAVGSVVEKFRSASAGEDGISAVAGCDAIPYRCGGGQT